MFSLGNTLILHVTEHDMVREITTCTSLDFGKPSYQAKERGALLGNGVLTSNGTHWAHQRKILAPELYMEKVKVILDDPLHWMATIKCFKVSSFSILAKGRLKVF